MIEPIATARPGDEDKRVDISWTGTGVSSNTSAFVYKDYGLINYRLDSAFVIGIVNDTDPNQQVDAANLNVCDGHW